MRMPPPSLKGRALRLLSQREHSRAELERKLVRHVQEGDNLAAVLDDLQAKDFISEQRTAESVVHRRAGRMGLARIRHELHAKGLSGEAMEQALAPLQDTELERAGELWRRKFTELPTDAAARAKHMRFLMARGFSGEVASRVLRAAARGEG